MKIISPRLLMSVPALEQSIIEWSPNYEVELADFQSPQTEVNTSLTSTSIFSGTNVDFRFQMAAGQFTFTKNFNAKATTTLNRKAAIITTPDTATALYLVAFGRYSFDLAELYSQKFRKAMYERKGAFSGADFF